MVCLECRAKLDPVWRWCPECGSLDLINPEAPDDMVERAWLDVDGRSDGRPPVGSSA